MDINRVKADMAAAALSVMGRESQNKRLLRMHFPRNDGPADAVMLVNSLRAHEEISRDFRFDVEVISDDARIPLKKMMAKMVTISLVREDGTLRYFNGYVNEFRLLRADGGFAFYQMVLEPWLCFLKLRRDCVSFIGRSVIELTDTTFGHCLQRDWRTRLYEDDPKLTCANQHNESDYNHLHRRWEARGLHYHYEHRANGHTLILGDNSKMAEPIDATAGEIIFRRESGSAECDGIHQWQAVRRLGSGQQALASHDYKNPRQHIVNGHSLNRQGDVCGYERYDNTGSYGFADSRGGEALAQRRIETLDAMVQHFEAAGNDRAAQTGRSFKLDGHFSAEPRRPERGEPAKASISTRAYLILSLDHVASNNYQAEPGAASHYENRFVCVRKSIRWRPPPHFNSEPCANPGVQTATVVGPEGQDIFTDGFGRIQLQFHWDRLGPRGVGSSPWIRVMAPLAGHRFGQSNIPRIGTEVAVMFLDSNIDKPVVIGAAYNACKMPPWELPGQSALSGLRSSELDNRGRGNHLILDDTHGAIQAQLKSDHQHSQLSLGHITRIEDSSGRKDARGEGFELRSDGCGALRSGKGMLISTEARNAACGHINDVGEPVQRLATAAEQHALFADLAQQLETQDKDGDQAEVAKELKAQQEAIKGAGPKGELERPHLLLSGAAGIEATTPQSLHLASGGHTAVTAAGHLSFSVGERMLASVRDGIRLLAHQMGMKLIAAAGLIEIKALTDAINIIAKLDIKIISTEEKIRIYSPKAVEIGAGDSFTIWKPGSITDYTQDRITNADFAAPGPKLMPGEVPPLPQGKICIPCMLKAASGAGAFGKIG